MSIEEFSFNEHRMIVAAEGRYGDFFRAARDVTLLLSNIMTTRRSTLASLILTTITG
jgi:hypothetical protein